MNLWPQSLSSLWDDYAKAEREDLPKTKIDVLDQIIEKATKSKEYGHLVKAELLRIGDVTDVTPDSLQGEVKCLEEKAAMAKKGSALAAVYQSVLGTVYRGGLEWEEHSDEISKQYFEQSLSDPKMLAATKAKTFTPLLVEGVDSKYFNDDLLSVLGIQAEKYEMLYDYYLSCGNREAACLAACLMMRNSSDEYSPKMVDSAYLAKIDQLIKEFGDLPVAGELALVRYEFMEKANDCKVEDRIRWIDEAQGRWKEWERMSASLRNSRDILICPTYSLRFGCEMVLPQHERVIELDFVKNLKSVTMKVARVDLDPCENYYLDNEKVYAKVKKAIVPGSEFTVTRHFEPHLEYVSFRDSLLLPPLDRGMYLAVFTTDNKEIKEAKRLFYVSDVYLLSQPMPDALVRFVAVSATTGQSLKNARMRYKGEKGTVEKAFDRKGELVLARDEIRYDREFYVYTNEDKYCRSQDMWMSHFSYSPTNDKETVNLYTDRAIYRPGQTVHVVMLVHHVSAGVDAMAVEGKKVTLTLCDANYKEVAEKEVTTDAFGKATADFVLPSAGLTGRYSVRGAGDMVTFRVEEYKRPTFEVEIPWVKQAYKNGDTLSVKGIARTYSGVPVQGAVVSYTVERTTPSWWWGESNSDEQLLTDTVTTDEKGEFVMTVPIRLPANVDADNLGWRAYYYDIKAVATVTDQGGESHTASISLPVSNKVTAFTFSLPEKAERASLKKVTFELKDVMGEPVDGEVTYYIDDEEQGHVAKTNVPTDLPMDGILGKSGKHQVKAVCNGDTVTRDIIVFSVDDKHPCVETHDWFYASSSNFEDAKTPVRIQVGSSDPNTIVYYSVFAEDKVIENGRFTLDSANQNRQWTYKKEYGDGLLLTFAWVREGVAYTHSHSITRPMPDKRILLKWETFRDRLTPGQEEQWMLRATYPDGTPADAQLMATIYDKSLDQIASHGWWFYPRIGVRAPYSRWYNWSLDDISAYGQLRMRTAKVPNFDFTYFGEDLFYFSQPRYFRHYSGGRMRLNRAMVMEDALMAAPMAMEGNKAAFEPEESARMSLAAEADVADEEDATTQGEEAEAELKNVSARENLDETAAFFPMAMADAEGRIYLKFTLPESVTTWRVIGIATDKEVCYGSIGGEAVAQKDIMVVPNIPRFLRLGDNAYISARIQSTTDHAVSGKARMMLIEPESEKTVYEETVDFGVEAGQTTSVTFSYRPEGNTGLLVCKIVAAGDGFSDGEQHYLPILPDREMITRTLPFTQNGPQTSTFDLTRLFPEGVTDGKLTIEYTNNPAWLMIQALPTMAVGDKDNAITQAMSYYANVLGAQIMHSTPDIRKVVDQWREETAQGGSLASALERNEELKDLLLNDTPWVGEADHEVSQKRSLVKFFDEQTISMRLERALSKLRELQLGDGSWSWWKGMDGSIYMTTAVSEMMVRVNKMAGKQEDTEEMLDGAFDFMGKWLVKEVASMKKYKWEWPSETALSILYNMALDGRQLPSDVKGAADYIIALFEKKNPQLTIFGKARGAVILSHFGRKARAEELMRSIDEYAVVTEEMGRYFDTRKAYYSWCSYLIPTEVAAIEAYQMLQPQNEKVVDEMRIWLLQQKRTQMWSTPINSVDAVYAFLNGNIGVLGQQPASKISIDGVPIPMSEATAGTGYVKTAMAVDAQRKLDVEKTSTGTSWGAVYAQFNQRVNDVEDASSGLSVTREVRNGGKPLKVGDKVVVRITVKAERDFDFVEVIDRRAACLEPVKQLSGYHYGYYIAPKDYTTTYYFDKMPKGTHVVETEYYIDRQGVYETGTCKVQCAYAPEFSATGKSLTIEVND